MYVYKISIRLAIPTYRYWFLLFPLNIYICTNMNASIQYSYDE